MTNKSFLLSKKLQPKRDFRQKSFCEFSNQGNRSMYAEATKKCFGFGKKNNLHSSRLMEKIFSPRKKSERPLGFLAQFSSINSRRKKLIFWILREKSHEVTWASPQLQKFLSKLREREVVAKIMRSQARKGMPKSFAEVDEKINQCIEDYSLIMF